MKRTLWTRNFILLVLGQARPRHRQQQGGGKDKGPGEGVQQHHQPPPSSSATWGRAFGSWFGSSRIF